MLELHRRLTKWVELVARADLTRASWQPLADAPGFALHWHPSSWVLGGRFFTAAADKKAC